MNPDTPKLLHKASRATKIATSPGEARWQS